jgi:hypothetical protein
MIVPVQLSFWIKDDPCFIYPTLNIDVFVDFFFLVGEGMPGYLERFGPKLSEYPLLRTALGRGKSGSNTVYPATHKK